MKPNDPMTPDSKNLLWAIVLSLLVMFGFYHFIDRPALKKQQEEQERQAQSQQMENPAPVTAPMPVIEPLPRHEVLQETKRIPINTPNLHGSINLMGGRLDDATLATYFETIEKRDEVTLLSPAETSAPYFVDYGFLGDEKKCH